MIVDDLRAVSPGFRRWATGAHVVRVPFSVVFDAPTPADAPDLDESMIPKTADDRLSCEWWRPVHDKLIVASQKNEPGIVFSEVVPGDPGDPWMAHVGTIVQSEARWRSEYPAWSNYFDVVKDDGGGAVVRMEDRRAEWAAFQSALTGRNFTAESVPADARSEWGAVLVFAMTMALLCCKNVSEERRDPPRQLQRARERRGQLPLVSWHVLNVRQAARGRSVGAGEPLALHWVRGHFKRYTPDRPLFGDVVGTFWWSPHLAGRSERVVLKDYKL